MATAQLGLTLLDVGQKEKEVTINQNFQIIDDKALRFLGDLASDPPTTNVPKGSTYYNTATSKLKVLRTNNTWANAA